MEVHTANVKKPDRINKEFMIRVRVTRAEHEKFVELAKEKGYQSVSSFIRSLPTDEKKVKEKSIS